MNKLEKAAADYEDNGGKLAIRGYNFQTYAAIFFMMALHKHGYQFKLAAEKTDDIWLENLTLNKKYKMQVKSEKLTPNKIITSNKDNDRSILWKLVLNSEPHDYITLVFGQERGDNLKKICKNIDVNLGIPSFTLDSERYEKDMLSKTDKQNYKKVKDLLDEYQYPQNKLIFHELPFTVKSDNCFNYLCSYCSNDYEHQLEKIQMSKEQIYSIAGTIYHAIDESSQIEFFTNMIFESVQNKNEKDKFTELIIKNIESYKGPIWHRKLMNVKGEYLENRILYHEILSFIKIDDSLCDISFIDYFNQNLKLIEMNLDEIQKKRINIYIITWYIIDKIVEKEIGEYDN
ncbi:hypothetical protein IX317_001089 [Fusobacterium sp. DD29]|uniref:dsDNA nuclease domain-containing protein n=1 Tax=unclassified Fusobacterium TaxID=2648384 RepID=UPI001B8BFF9D|nr:MULTISPECIES: dsDNA nuclease domain-containing protein [unclassified Fusobacterium]MBR8701288.1 hypothetical protein [Fusobacterium sp. DD45]MBR8711096.1 hypothetical protein [Fusobacterium sp. DD28]MBR8749415.1 hypothetical protein [Fusobacterium sp. DD29]MBR8751670.1 hypothetical protein [Fusobacterium sp. DD26]MBR8761695.1 hypothetical protein [Fusobacterium sp. DD25]